jgi:hypothetical protein
VRVRVRVRVRARVRARARASMSGAFCSSSVSGSGLISRTALVAEVETTLMLPASKAAEIEMAVEKAEPTTAPESMKRASATAAMSAKRMHVGVNKDC